MGPAATERDDAMVRLFVRRPLQRRGFLIIHLAVAAVIILAMAALRFAIAGAVDAQRDAITLVELARDQQALAQRIAYLVDREAEGDRASEFQGGQATDRFRRTHEQMRRADPALGVSPASAAAFQALYTGGDRPLATTVDEVLALLRAAEDGASRNPKAADLDQAVARFAGETLPYALDPIVKATLRANAARIDAYGWTYTLLCALIMLALLVESLAVAWPMSHRIGRFEKKLDAIDAMDPGTGALTAESFAHRSLLEIRRARRYRRPVSVLTIATEGPSDGSALRHLYDDLAETLRPSDFVGISDDGVFSVLLTETDLYAAELAAHRILREIGKRRVAAEGGARPVGVSIGVAQARSNEAFPEEPLARAMACLRQARPGEGGRVAVSPMRHPASTPA